MTPIVVTPGEPAGIGPDILLRLASEGLPCPLVAMADPDLMAQRAAQLGLNVRLHSLDGAGHVAAPSAAEYQAGELWLEAVPLARAARPGQLDTANAGYVLETIRRATRGCLEGRYRALVTGPVHKGIINEAGIRFSGHTEYLANLSKADCPVMMLTGPDLRVALYTTHLPLSQVSAALNSRQLERVIRVLHTDLMHRFGIAQPRIAVCGLNPHAGEGGHLGSEEQDIIMPLLERLRDEGMQLLGPLPADTAFTRTHLAQSDVTLAMYHDQGLPVLKHASFGQAVNITLGLPFVRTSVDHGTALDLAGRGEADIGSLRSALEAAMDMTTNG